MASTINFEVHHVSLAGKDDEEGRRLSHVDCGQNLCLAA